MDKSQYYSIMNANDGNTQFSSFTNVLLKEKTINSKSQILSEIVCPNKSFYKNSKKSDGNFYNDNINQICVKNSIYSTIFSKSLIDLSLIFDNVQIEFIQNLNFLLGVTDTILIRSELIGNKVFNSDFFFIIKYIFTFKIYELHQNKSNDIKIGMLINIKESSMSEHDIKNFLMDSMLDLFNQSFSLFEFSIEDKDLFLECFCFKFIFTNVDDNSDKIKFNDKNITEINLSNKNKYRLNNKSTLLELDKERLTKLYNFSQNVFFIDDKFLENLSKEIVYEINIDKTYYKLLSTGYEILNNWSKIVNSGNYIKNFGDNVKEFIEKLNKEFNFETNNSSCNNYMIQKSENLSESIYKKIIKLFTKQLLMLQTQALDKFKDVLIDIVSKSDNDFEIEKTKLIQKVKDWFVINSKDLRIPELNLNINNALIELEQVLTDFAQKFNDSPVYKLLSLNKINRSVKNSSFKQTGMIVGFGLTAAARLRGFGNFQLVSSYSHGPHVLNFSIVNDKDIAEQEGQSKVKTFRIQPSLNFDVDL
ncbi:hypothetical protein (nucleomorph) [Guillardia theta]|uniref:Uncharacterized protein n=2 Tax=Guillardia theta TaxID=55529 RepID=Q98RU9_GUITH|nr:hypothetical protein GTHECHR1058 [Guillardia theta]AAK39850.1 hypothetical protein [Guillardia theta]